MTLRLCVLASGFTVFENVVDKRTMNKLGAGVSSVFATLIPLVLALQPDVSIKGNEDCQLSPSEELSEVRRVVSVLQSHMPNVSSSCLQNRTLASLFEQAH